MSEMFKLSPAVKKAAVVFLLLPPLLFSLASLFLLVYIFFPIPMQIEDIAPAENITLLAHGVHDSPKTWSGDLADIIAQSSPDDSVVALNWSEYADSIFRCSVNGLRMGHKIGKKLTADKNIKTLHLIGHSCGAFVVYGICQQMKSNSPAVLVQTTYLDPASNYGGVFNNFGIKNFGSCADFSDAYIDRDDNVPGSNQKLPYAYTTDITDIREKNEYSGNSHLWPTKYYARLFQKTKPPLLKNDRRVAEKFPPGKIEILK